MSVFELVPSYRYHPAMHAARRGSNSSNAYPAYNIDVAGDDRYRVTLAVPGFTEQQLSIEVDNQLLTVTGQQATANTSANSTTSSDTTPSEPVYKAVHRGIAQRNFERRFELAEHVEVVDAKLDHGVLVVNLVKQVPDARKPKRIVINTGEDAAAQVVDEQAA